MRVLSAVAVAALLLSGAVVRAEEEKPKKPATTVGVTLTVDPRPWGVSTRYIGGTEGNMRFDLADLTDCGINTLRLYADMSRFEPVDDDGVYGAPTIAEIKADPKRLPWERWDAVMDRAYSPQVPKVTWRSLFADLQRGGVCPVLSLRNRDTNLDPKWMAAIPQTEADWNEWWEYVFAMAYWLNVRNDYRVDEYEVLNEPENSPQQGWLGTQAQYNEMVTHTKEALDYVYRTYLPGRAYHVHAPVGSGPAWVPGVLADVGDHFDSLNVHNYAWWDKGALVQNMHRLLRESGHPDYPIWLSEWATYDVSYDVPWMGLAMVENLIRYSRPGDDAVYGSHVFSFYDWDYGGVGASGLITKDGTRRHAYYALRLATRALAGAKPTYQVPTGNPELHAIATREKDGRLNVLVLNWDEATRFVATVRLSGLMAHGAGTIRHFSATAHDQVVGTTPLRDGSARVTLPPWSAVLITFRGR